MGSNVGVSFHQSCSFAGVYGATDTVDTAALVGEPRRLGRERRTFCLAVAGVKAREVRFLETLDEDEDKDEDDDARRE